jgi:uncharacterized membrane protein
MLSPTSSIPKEVFMDIRSLKKSAQERLSNSSYSPARLALLNTGVAVALSLLITLVNFLLNRQISNTGGLAGIGTRTVLSSVQLILIIGGSIVMPFWDAGFLRAALCISRNESVGPTTLLEGFRRFGSVLRLTLLRGILCVLIGFFCLQAASAIFMMLPLSNNFMDEVFVLMESGAALDDAAVEVLMPHLFMVYVLWAVFACIILIPLLYRFRLADWAIMDQTPRALAAFSLSGICTRGNRFSLFQLDLSFWWYYGLQLLAAILAYGDTLLTALGVNVNANAAFFAFYILSLAIQLLIAWRFAPRVQTTYALAYENLLQRSGFAKTQA